MLSRLVPLALAVILATTAPARSEDQQHADPDPEAVAEHLLDLTDTVLEHHVAPPTRQEMLLRTAEALYRPLHRPGTRRARPRLARRISELSSRAEQREFLVGVLRDSPGPRTKGPLDDAARRAFIEAVGPNVNISVAAEQRVQEQFAANRYVGIGITLHIDRERKLLTMGKVIPGGPADEAGAKDGDLILEVDGVSTKGKSITEVVKMLRGERGTEVGIVLRHPSEVTERRYTLTRDVVPFRHVTGYEVFGAGDEDELRIAYLKVERITGSTVHELRGYEDRLRRDDVDAVLLDLRDQFEPPLHFTVLLAGALADGDADELGSVRTADGVRKLRAGPDRLFRDLRLAVLVNPNVHGPAEWLAAALQDTGRATIIGRPTLGAGYVYEAVPVADSDFVLELPTGVLVRPSGQDLVAPSPSDTPRPLTVARRDADGVSHPVTPAADAAGRVVPEILLEPAPAVVTSVIPPGRPQPRRLILASMTPAAAAEKLRQHWDNTNSKPQEP